MKHHVSHQHLQALSNNQKKAAFQHASNKLQNNDPRKNIIVQQLKRKTGLYHTAVRIIQDVERWRKVDSLSYRQEKKRKSNSESSKVKGLKLMKQICGRPASYKQTKEQIDHRKYTLSATGLNKELKHVLNQKNPSPIALLSYLHRLRQRDAPNANFVSAFQLIAVDNERVINMNILSWKSIMAASFKSLCTNESIELLERLFSLFQTKREKVCDTGYMDARYPLCYLCLRRTISISTKPTLLSKDYHSKLSTTLPYSMNYQKTKKIACKFIYAIWNVLCWHNLYTTTNEFNKAMRLFVPYLPPIFENNEKSLINYKLIQKIQLHLSRYQCRVITISLWNLISSMEKCTHLVKCLTISQNNFINAYIPMRLNTVNLKYRFNKIKPIFKAWRKYYDWTVHIERQILFSDNRKRRKAIQHFYNIIQNMIKAKQYYKNANVIAHFKWLSISFHRVKRITKRLRDYKLLKLNNMSFIFFQKIHLPIIFTWWFDATHEMKNMEKAIPLNSFFIIRHWFHRLKIFVKKQIKDRKIDAMRLLFHEQEMEELKKVDDKNSFFLTKKELDERQERIEKEHKRLKELEFQKIWDKNREKAAQGRIRIQQARDRVIHRAQVKSDNIKHRKDVWKTMEDEVLPKVAEKARIWCTTDFKGKKYIRTKIDEMFQTSLSECQHLLYNNALNIEGCAWQAVNEVPGVIMSPVAWSNVSTGESIKYNKMTGTMCKKICIERHVATELLRVKQDFLMRRQKEEQQHLEISSAILCQSVYHMRKGRQRAMKIFQEHWIILVDCFSGECMYYNLISRITKYQPPYFLNRGERVERFSTINARGPTVTNGEDGETGKLILKGAYWYEYRPKPYRPETQVKSFSWNSPNGVMKCEKCQIALVRRRCMGNRCITDRSCYIYLCFYCYDELHPIEDTGDSFIDQHRNHDHIDYISPSIETFLCSICQKNTSSLYCRDGDCRGNMYCRQCYNVIHLHVNDHWHVPNEIQNI
jgi:hypothetical protein